MREAVDLSKLVQKWPSSLVARSEVGKFTGGVISPGTLANLDCKGLGPQEKIRIGKKVVYDASAFVEWLRKRIAGDDKVCVTTQQE